jgi:BirA family transcriptional regulator, biotin operon repressor / biotin---[acetyl-CoA-carboxylase] ligase
LYNIQPNTLFIGKNVIYLPSCHSTNTLAAQMIQNQGLADGTIVITSNQTAGRGQRGNVWQTMPGQNITASFVLKPTFLTATEQFKLNIAVSLAVHEFLSNYIEDELFVKWPNDIYVKNQKLGGILIENSLVGSRIAYSVIGIGLNINQIEFADDKATSLRLMNPKVEFDLEKLVAELSESLERKYFELKNNFVNHQKIHYLKTLYRYQETHEFEKDEIRFMGTIVGVANDGRLAVEVSGDVRYFDFKEIRFVIE